MLQFPLFLLIAKNENLSEPLQGDHRKDRNTENPEEFRSELKKYYALQIIGLGNEKLCG